MKQVCITFDDGRLDNYIYALPVMEKYGILATFYITTGYIDGSFKAPTWKTSLGPMTIENIVDLKNAGHEIALHGDCHRTEINDFNICFEKMNSWLGENNRYGFSIPGSHYSTREIEEFRKQSNDRILYIRGGSQGGSANKYIRKVQKGLRIYTGSRLIYNIYNKKNILFKIDSGKVIPAIGVRKTDSVGQLESFISKLPDETTAIFMFHSVVPKNSAEYGADAWGWSKENFERFCSFIAGNHSVITTPRLCDIIE